MNTIWHATKEGRQYFVQANPAAMRLEMSSDCVSELAGSGYTIELPDPLDADHSAMGEIRSLFGPDAAREILAFSRALRSVRRKDLEDRTDALWQAYWRELEALLPPAGA